MRYLVQKTNIRIMKRSLFYMLLFAFLPAFVGGQNIKLVNGLAYNEDGSLLEGKYHVLYDNGQTKEEYNYHNGILEGYFTAYHENGVIKEQGLFNNGQKHGKWTKWTTDNQKIGMVKYNNGFKGGKWQIWDPNGT